MTLLLPLGLIALLSIIILIIIYIIKPNYQNKYISSTYIWKLSLKYRRKKIPVSKLRSILIFLCQLLSLALCAIIIAEPVLIIREMQSDKEVVIILDSSASMLTEIDYETRFERAVIEAQDLSDSVLAENGVVSVILAGDTQSEYLAVRQTDKTVLSSVFAALSVEDENDYICYGSSDINEALTLAEEVLEQNSAAEIHVFTDNEYSYIPSGITVHNVYDKDYEWNGAILDAYTTLENGYYCIYVDFATYGRAATLDYTVNVLGGNASNIDSTDGVDSELTGTIDCDGETTTTLIITYFAFSEGNSYYENSSFYGLSSTILDSYEINTGLPMIYSYQGIEIFLTDADDSFSYDNSFYIYDGQKEVINIQYASSLSNKFMTGVLDVLKNSFSSEYDIKITEVSSANAATSGFDFYIFEHSMPEIMPTDGVVLLFDPDSAPENSGIRVDGYTSLYGSGTSNLENVALAEEETHTILENVTADNVTISRYCNITVLDSTYTTLWSCNGSPVLMLKDEGAEKVIVLGFSIHYSNLALTLDFPVLMYNIFDYFFPSTVESNSYEVNETVTLNARGPELSVYSVEDDRQVADYDEFPAYITFTTPGTYTLTQTSYYDEYATVTEKIYVRVPEKESDIFNLEDTLNSPYSELEEVEYYSDLLLYFAIALVSLLFLEWILHTIEGI